MNKRLRFLDSLFAERILCIPRPHYYEVGPNRDFDFLELDLTGYGSSLNASKIEHYTRSIDLALLGVKKLGPEVLGEEFGIRLIPKENNYTASNSIYEPFDCNPTGIAEHPAEAIVLACLNALTKAVDAYLEPTCSLCGHLFTWHMPPGPCDYGMPKGVKNSCVTCGSCKQ